MTFYLRMRTAKSKINHRKEQLMHTIEQAFDGTEDDATKVQYYAATWFERDRQHVSLYRDEPHDNMVFELWDDDFNQAIIDGYLRTPRVPRPTTADWLPCLIEYAKNQGLLP